MIKQLLQYFLFLSFFFCLLSCDTNDPPPPDNGNGNGNDKPKPKITLSVDDTSPTEVWLNLITENIPLPDTLSLIRNNDTVKIIELFDSSYVIYEDSLQPSTTYTYHVSNNQQPITSNVVTTVTMDTTSHDFSWEVFEFGEHGNSVLRDAAIIDENNIWAVGAIYLKDSTGANDSKAYNAVHWDGSEWKHRRIQFYTFCNQPRTSSYPARSILAFSEQQILISSGSQVTLYDGENQVYIECIPVSVNKMWGTDINNVYVVGAIGGIAHYNGTSWRKIESGTDLTLSDVYGNNYNSVYVSGTDISTVSGVLLNGNQSGFSVVKNSGIIDESQLFEQLYGELSAVWIDEKGTVYTGGNLLFWNRRGEWDYVSNLPENYLGGNPGVYYRGFISSIRGNSSNDYILAGDRNTLRHYNGKTWKQLGMAYDPNSRYIWYEVEQKDDLIVAVGRNAGKATIIKLKR